MTSWPDFRLLVRSTGDDNHETTLVVPELLIPQVRYARLLVDEGSDFVEHAVAFIESSNPDPDGIVAGALSAARPTRVSFVRLRDGLGITGGSPADLNPAQLAACATCVVLESKGGVLKRGTENDDLLDDTLQFVQGAFRGRAKVRQIAQLFEVQVLSD